MLEDRQLADLPIVIAAIDPCFSCTDRSFSVKDTRQRSRGQIKWEDLRTYSIEWYRGKGIDFSKLNKKMGERL